MVHTRKSEYEHQFKRSPNKYVSRDFEQKQDYRIQRRATEHSHFQFDWDNQSVISSSDSQDIEKQLAKAVPHKKEGDPPHVQKHKTYIKKYEERIKEFENQEVSPEIVAEDVQPEPEVPKKNDDIEQPKKRNKKVQHVKENPKENDVETDARPEDAKQQRPCRHRRAKKVSKSRPKSAPAPTKSSSQPNVAQPGKENHPFLGYGNGDNERETGNKRTYNIKAPCDVYPSALRALKRREFEIKKRQERVRSAPLRLKRKTSLFNEKMARETSMWDTEYRKHFIGYSENEYKKNLSARLPH